MPERIPAPRRNTVATDSPVPQSHPSSNGFTCPNSSPTSASLSHSYAMEWWPYLFQGSKTVVFGECPTTEEARAKAVAFAVSIGYTRPRWWQFWRWSEQPAPLEEALDWFATETLWNHVDMTQISDEVMH